jgi:ABC-type transport system involved in cytochrome c biogenesis permease subunit
VPQPHLLTAIAHPLVAALYGGAFLTALFALMTGQRHLPTATRCLTAAGLVTQTVMIASRWQAGDHFPVTGLFETLHFLAWWVAGITLYYSLRYRANGFLPAGLGLTLLAIGAASLGPQKIFPLIPSLDTPLFFIHVATSFAAYGLWGTAALLAIFELADRDPGQCGRWQRMQDEAIYLGYILFTWCMLAGSLWAYLSWGSYWTWKIKGIWSYILWFYYSGVIHIRRNPRWQGWPADLLALAGFTLVLFTYLGLGVFFKTNHPLL